MISETMAPEKQLCETISVYAEAYGAMQAFQDADTNPGECLIPKGDQKTGCIGEFWAMRYARKHWDEHECTFGNTSQQGWDLKIGDTGTHIQVKTVSEWSKTRRLSPIHNPDHRPRDAADDWAPWTDLWLVYLNKTFSPTGFWKMAPCEVEFGDAEYLRDKTMQTPGNPDSGSHCFTWPANTVTELLA